MSETKKEIKITVIPEFNLTMPLNVGDTLQLVPDPYNQYDPNCVALERNGRRVGNVAASAHTVQPGTLSARSMKKRFENPDLAEVWCKLTEKTSVVSSTGGTIEAYIGVCSFLPKEKQADEAAPQTTYAGGTMVSNPVMADTIGKVRDSLLSGEKLPTIYIKFDQTRADKHKAHPYYFVVNPTDDATKSCGEVQVESAEMKLAVQQNGFVPMDIAGLCKASDGTPVDINDAGTVDRLSYWGHLVTECGVGTNIKEAMQRAVRDCRARYSELDEKVKYLINEAVPEKVIVAVLDSIHECDPAWAHLVPHPQTMFHQQDAFGELTRVLAYRAKNQNIRLVGNKGSGKNTLAECVDWIFGIPQYRLQGNAELDKTDILGSQTLKSGTMEYRLSEMLQCLQAGGNVLLDEGNTVRPEVADLLHSLTDGARSIQVPGFGLVKMHPRACVTLTMNEGYMGTTKMNDATVDRFVPIHMDCPRSIVAILKEAVPTATMKNIKTCDRVYCDILAKTEGQSIDGALDPDALTIRGFIDALQVCDLIGLKAALLDNVSGKPQDEYARSQLREVIAADCK